MIYDKYKDRIKAIPYPARESLRQEHMRQIDTFVGTKAEIAEREEQLKAEFYKTYSAACDAYNKAVSVVMDEYLKGLFAEKGINNDAVNQLVYQEAYDRGHSAGHHEVESYFIEFIEFAKALIDASIK